MQLTQEIISKLVYNIIIAVDQVFLSSLIKVGHVNIQMHMCKYVDSIKLHEDTWYAINFLVLCAHSMGVHAHSMCVCIHQDLKVGLDIDIMIMRLTFKLCGYFIHVWNQTQTLMDNEPENT